MDNYYERLNQAFANWNGGGEPSLEQRVENLESEILQKQDILTFDTEPVENSENPVTSGGLFSHFERYATKTALNERVEDLDAEIIQKQDILTFDTEPVENSENPVTSGGLFSQFERYATKVALDGKVDTSNFTADQNRQDALESEDRAALVQQIDGGAKNFLDTSVSTLKKYNTSSSSVWNDSSCTQNGITYSVNSDGSISVSGTATSASFLVLANRAYLNAKIVRGRYSISGCPTGGGSSGATYRIFCLNPNANISSGYTDTGNGYIGEFYYDDSKDCNISIGIGKGCVITDPIVFKPMLCTAADYTVSPAFVPYRPSWQEMWDMIQALQSGS